MRHKTILTSNLRKALKYTPKTNMDYSTSWRIMSTLKSLDKQVIPWPTVKMSCSEFQSARLLPARIIVQHSIVQGTDNTLPFALSLVARTEPRVALLLQFPQLVFA